MMGDAQCGSGSAYGVVPGIGVSAVGGGALNSSWELSFTPTRGLSGAEMLLRVVVWERASGVSATAPFAVSVLPCVWGVLPGESLQSCVHLYAGELLTMGRLSAAAGLSSIGDLLMLNKRRDFYPVGPDGVPLPAECRRQLSVDWPTLPVAEGDLFLVGAMYTVGEGEDERGVESVFGSPPGSLRSGNAGLRGGGHGIKRTTWGPGLRVCVPFSVVAAAS